jgi:beta-aspartyl-peptidase (threonine type)
MQTAIIVHGGAGAWALGKEKLEEAMQACRAAAEEAQILLSQGGTALDAVEAATRFLEDCSILDAGRGSYPNSAGDIEMDALIMDGGTLDLGAVGAIQRVRHPVSLARRIMTDCEHTFLVGTGADAFADEIGFPRCSADELLTGTALEKLQRLAQNGSEQTSGQQEVMGTVGAVARDARGNLAAAVSTGGTSNKRPGRLGDSPLVGCGAYADNWSGAAVATGYGEALMKVVISHRLCQFMADGLTAQEACQAAIQILAQRAHGHGGVIAIDGYGRVGHACNTAGMPVAYALGSEPVKSAQ